MDPDSPQLDSDSPRLTGRKPVSGLRLAGSFLYAGPAPDATRPTDWARAGRWLAVWGLVFGVFYAALFRVAWRSFGEYEQIRFVPMALLLLVDMSFFGRRLVIHFAQAVFPADEPDDPVNLDRIHKVTLLIGLLIILKYALLLSLPIGARIWPIGWREYLGPLYPGVIYRPLILMPLWGRWAMMLAMTIGRLAPDQPPHLVQMAAGLRLRQVLLQWLAIAALSILYLSPALELIGYPMLLALTIMVVVYLSGFFFSRRFAGQSESTIHAVGLLAELTFLMAWISASRSIYWY